MKGTSAWEPEFGGAVIDYGTWPKQPLRYFGESNPPKGLDRLYGGTEESWILAGLTALVGELLGREFRREDGAMLRIGRLLIDAGYKTELVRTFCRRHPQAAIIGPALGHYIGATSKPFADYRPEPGAQLGLHWRMPPNRPHVSIDANWCSTSSDAPRWTRSAVGGRTRSSPGRARRNYGCLSLRDPIRKSGSLRLASSSNRW